MLTFFPLASFFLLYFIFLFKNTLKRESFLYATLAWGGLIFASTEFLNLFKLITLEGILSFWILTTAGLIALFFQFKKSPFTFSRIKYKPSIMEIIWGIGILCIVVITGLICLKSPPNNWDSMIYHLGRVVHWMQNKSVEHYPTSIPNQIWKKPLAEYIILHFQILSGGDYFSNFVQWFSLIGCLFSTSLIAQKLGASRQGQIITAIISSTIPMGILQATSTQNDYVTAYWMTCFVYLIISYFKSNEQKNILGIALSLSLSLYTKETTFIYATPFVIWLAIRGFTQYKLSFLKTALIATCIILIVNFPQAKRNFTTFGNIISPQQVKNTVKNTSFTPKSLTSNLIRYIGLQFGSMNEEQNLRTEEIIKKIHTFLRIDINDPRTSSMNFVVPRDTRHEDNSSNLLHLILIIFAGIQYIFNKKLRQNTLLKEYFWICLATSLLFVFFLKWTLFRNRLLLPIAILFAPLIGIAIAQLKQKKRIFISLLPLILAWPWLLYNQTKPLIGKVNVFSMSRKQQYFSNNPRRIRAFYPTVDYIISQKCANVGLILGGDSWEYPFWQLLKNQRPKNSPKIRIEHIEIKPPSPLRLLDYPLGKFTPCIVIAENDSMKNFFFRENKAYVKTGKFSYFYIWEIDFDGKLRKKNLFNHFVKTIQELNSIKFLKKNESEYDIKVIKKKTIVLLEAQLVDMQELDKIYPNLKFLFKTTLFNGLNNVLYGFQHSDQEKYTKGLNLLQTWDTWFNHHEKGISQGLLKYKQ